MAKQKKDEEKISPEETGATETTETTDNSTTVSKAKKPEKTENFYTKDQLDKSMENAGLSAPRVEQEYDNTQATPQDSTETPKTETPKPESPKENTAAYKISADVRKMDYSAPPEIEEYTEEEEEHEDPKSNSSSITEPGDFDTDDGSPTAAEQIGSRTGTSTSEFIWRNVENGTPIIGGFFTQVKDNFIFDATIPEQDKLDLINQVQEYNKESKAKFIVPQWHKDNIKPALKVWMEERGWENVIPPWVELAVGVLFFGGWIYMTIQEVNKSRHIYESKLQTTVDDMEKRHLQHLSEIEAAHKRALQAEEKPPQAAEDKKAA